jgi:hypothetical protein
MSFSGDIARFASNVQAQNDQQVRVIALELFRRVILKTPVDTGRARANWQFSRDTPSAVPTAETDKSGGATVEKIGSELQKEQAGGVFWLANNLPYIRVLEYGEYPDPNAGTKTVGGYSKQAPAGMVRVTAAEFGTLVKEST